MEVEQYGAGTSSGRHRIRIRGAHRNTHAYMDTFVPLCFFFFCVSLSSVCRLLICLPLALSLCHHRHRDYPHYEHVSIARCVRGGERFLQCQQVDQDKGVPTIHPSNQCPIPISDPFPPRDSHSHSQSSGQT